MALNYKFKAEDIIAEGRTSTENIKDIKTWILHTKEMLVPKELQDEVLVLFLLSCSNDVELTKKTIVSYYKLKKTSPLIFDNRKMDCPEIQLILNTMAFCFVRNPKAKEIMHFYRLRDHYYKNAKIEYALKVVCMLIDVCQEENPPDSIIFVIDVEGCGWMHLTMVHVEALKTVFSYIQDASPVKTKSIHFVNSNLMLQKFLSFAKIFMKQGTVNKVHCHQGIKDLTKFIPEEYLPEDYNGPQPALEELRKVTISKFENRQEFWEKEEQMRKECYMPN